VLESEQQNIVFMIMQSCWQLALFCVDMVIVSSLLGVEPEWWFCFSVLLLREIKLFFGRMRALQNLKPFELDFTLQDATRT
jgi:hypothetical protein